MKINLKLRLKNPYFYYYLIASIVTPIGIYFGVNLEDLTTWPKVWDLLVQAVLTPYVFVTVVLSVTAFVIDPTTEGVNDSKQALQYEKPKPKGW